jgi:hypothetical protein
MTRFKKTLLFLACMLSGVLGFARALPAEDIVIYGATSGGVAAAIQAAREGRTVVLIEPTNFVGGLTTGGLGATDIGNKRAIGGLSREFYTRIFQYYSDESKWRQQTRSSYFERRPNGSSADEGTMWTFEPHVASAVYGDMLKAAGDKITLVFGERLDFKKGVLKDSSRIRKIVMESGRTFTGKVFIDATYEGDLMAMAGVRYHVGREANSVYGETLNGVQVGRDIHHQFEWKVDPYVKTGDASSGLLPGIEGEVPGPDGSGDHKVQAYNFRMCTTDAVENRRDWEKPEGYDERLYELALRNVEAGDERHSWAPTPMPNRKTDTNNNKAISTDFIGQNWDYAEADYQTRAKIWRAHEDWQKGLMWTYAHHPRVPQKIQAVFQRFGLAKDEFTENGNWPRQLYVREARRMISDYVMSEKNCRRTEVVEDSVGMGAYNMDSHHVQRYVTPEGFVRNEGDVQVGSRPYPISYRSIRPKASECTNLLVPVCISASHIAYGSIRMEPVFMVLGQSAATAAGLAIERGTSVQAIDCGVLKERLTASGQVLDFEVTPASAVRGLPKASVAGIVLDDTDAVLKGFEASGHTTPGYVGDAYRHDGNEGKGTMAARFTPDLPEAGRYRIAVSYGENANRATNVPVTVRHDGGEERFFVNQKLKPKGDGPFHVIGVFQFSAGRNGWAEISNAGTDGHVIVDAVQWLPAAVR